MLSSSIVEQLLDRGFQLIIELHNRKCVSNHDIFAQGKNWSDSC